MELVVECVGPVRNLRHGFFRQRRRTGQPLADFEPRRPGAALAWDNVLYESPSLGYVVNTHQRGLDHGPAVLTYYYPLTDPDPRAARTRLLGTDRDVIHPQAH